MQFLVPQFIDTEDKIVGPLTLRQFGYVAVAGALCFAIYFFVNGIAWFIFTLLIGGAGIALAFVKINGRPLSVVTMAAFHYFWQPQQYVWQSEHKIERGKKSGPSEERPALEKIVAGIALKTAWQTVVTGSKPPEGKLLSPPKPANERYQIFRGLTGEQRAARRIDYR